MPQAWRDRIQTTMIVKRLEKHVNGEVELTPSQVTAGLGLLRKTIPDLGALTVSGDENAPPVRIQGMIEMRAVFPTHDTKD